MAQSPAGNDPIYGANSFLFKSPFKVKASVVTFFLRGHLDAKKVIVTGRFTNWSTTEVSMNKTDSGWIADIKLPPGRHSYKFIIDGQWKVDEDNLVSELDGSAINSVYYKPNVIFTLSAFRSAKNVFLTGSFVGEKLNLPLQKTSIGWELPLYLPEGSYLYQFMVDGKSYADPTNSNIIPNDSGPPNSLLLIGKADHLYKAFLSWVQEGKEDRRKLADFYGMLGYGQMQSSRYVYAQQSFQKASNIYQQLKDYDSTASMFFNIAIAYKKLSDFPRLLNYLQKSISNYRKANNEQELAKVLREAGYYYLNLPYNPTAAEYFHRSLELYDKLNMHKEKGDVLGDLGHTYLLMRDSVKSFFYLTKALDNNQAMRYKKGMAHDLWILGDYYLKMSRDYQAAYDCLQRSMKLYEEIGDQVRSAYVLYNLATFYKDVPDSILERLGINPKEKYSIVLASQKKVLEIFKEMSPESELQDPLYQIHYSYLQLKQYDSAYYYFLQFAGLRDKIAGTEKQKDIVRLETRYQNERKEDSLRLENQLTEEKLQGQLLLDKQQQQQLTLISKEKELQHLAYLKTQADLQNEQLAYQQKEKQLSLSEKEKELQSAKVKTLIQEKAIAKLSQQRQWMYVAAGFILLAFVSANFIYRWRIRSVQTKAQLVREKSERRQKEAEFQHKLADISLSALQSQMNPHFIFNSMNSIKSLINKNENDKAASYLTTFSKLIRTLFNNSDKREVSLFEELETCKLYTQLEKMRFGDKVEFVFDVDGSVDLKDIKVPALILQPFIENAIWHGLVPKETGGKVTVNVIQNNGSVECIIDDDGIGRELSAQYKAQYDATHQSKGIGLAKSRLELDKVFNERESSIGVIDKKDGNGMPVGTKVILTFKEN